MLLCELCARTLSDKALKLQVLTTYAFFDTHEFAEPIGITCFTPTNPRQLNACRPLLPPRTPGTNADE